MCNYLVLSMPLLVSLSLSLSLSLTGGTRDDGGLCRWLTSGVEADNSFLYDRFTCLTSYDDSGKCNYGNCSRTINYDSCKSLHDS